MKLKVTDYIKAGYPLLALQTTEQERALTTIMHQIKTSNLPKGMVVFVWKVTHGLVSFMAANPESEQITYSLIDSLKYMANGDNGSPHKNRIYVLFNVKDFLKMPDVKQQFRDTAYQLRTVGSAIICVGGQMDIPEELDDVFTPVNLDLPSKEELKESFKEMITDYNSVLKIEKDQIDGVADTAADNATGLTAFKAENAMALSICVKQSVDIDMLRHEKQMAVKQSGVLEFIDHNESSDTLGGFDVLKDHVSKRVRYFNDHKAAQEFGLDVPKGIMLTGLAGTGKSLAAKVIANQLSLPLYKFDVGALFKGIVGASESALKGALKLIETVSPCVLLVDEAEKLLSGLESSGKSDSGVTSRLIGGLLTWMQSTTAPVYKVATCNSITNMDAAMFRRGRWDAVFGVDLPNSEERSAIYAIHLQKRKRSPKDFDLDALAAVSEGFVGAEIESAVSEALYLAFDAKREVTTDDLITVTGGIVPISKTDKEAITIFQTWLRDRATPVSSKKGTTNLTGQYGKRQMPGVH